MRVSGLDMELWGDLDMRKTNNYLFISTRFKLSILLSTIFMSGCSITDSSLIKNIKIPEIKIPFLYAADIKQGNVFTKEQISKVKIGMSFADVVNILGSPSIQDPFHGYRVDYINRSIINGKEISYQAIIFFDRQTELVKDIKTSGTIPD